MIVDEVEEVRDLPESMVEKKTPDKNDPSQFYITGVGKTDKGLVSILDLATVIGEKEIG